MINIIKNPNSTVAYFRQDDYDLMITAGINKRDLEKGGIQKLLQKLGYEGLEIAYRQTGQPYFTQKRELFFSVSHAKGWFAVIVGSEPVGIDIQTVSKRLKQGQDYFRNERELEFSEDDRALHLIWGAKEAFYKLKEGQIPDLKEEVSLKSIQEESLILEFESEKHDLGYKILDEAFLVFTK